MWIRSEGSHDPEISMTLLHKLLQAEFNPHVCQTCQKDLNEKVTASTLRIIIDSGATCHMLPCDALFSGHIVPSQGKVLLGDTSHQLESVGSGSTNLKVLGSVLYVPKLTYGLISVPQLMKAGLTTEFKDGRVLVKDNLGAIKLSGLLVRDLFYLDCEYVERLWTKSACSCCQSADTLARGDVSADGDDIREVHALRVQELAEGEKDLAKGSANPKPVQTITGVSPFDRLHHELGHMSETYLKKALKGDFLVGTRLTYDDVKDQHLRFCPSCMEGRMRAFPRVKPGNKDREYLIWEKFSIDYKGKFAQPSIDGYTGFYLVSEYATCNLFVFLVKSKGEVATLKVLNDFMSTVVSEGGKPQVMQCDYDTVLLCKGIGSWITAHNLKLQVSAPYVHSQNGFVEVNIGKVMDKARTMMCAGMVPANLWSYAVRHAVFLWNRTPVRGSEVTPYEARWKAKPDVSALVPFYCTGVFHRTAEERKGPWDRKAQRCFMVGMDERTKNGYLVKRPQNNKVLTRFACVWDEALTISYCYDWELNDRVKEPDGLNDLDFLREEQKDVGLASDDEEEAVTELPDSLGSVPVIETDEDLYESDSDFDESDIWSEDEEDEASKLRDRTLPLSHRPVPVKQQVWPVPVKKRLWPARLWPVAKSHVNITKAMIDVKSLPKLPVVKTWEEAMASPYAKQWREALLVETDNFDTRKVFEDAEQHGRAMKTKLIFRVSYTDTYELKFRVRLVACGYSQIYGVDYKETYAPTTSTVVVFLLMQLGTYFGLEFASFDVSAAFLEGKSDFVNYARLPSILGGHRVKVVGNFYGEKQGPKIWNDHLNAILVDTDFERCPAHPCLYRWKSGADFLVTTVHVDDGLMVSNSLDVINGFFTYFLSRVRKASLQYPLTRYLGMSLSFDKEHQTVGLDHELYITTAWGDVTTYADTPMSAAINLRTSEEVVGNPSLLPVTGKFRYLADHARPDMLLVTGEVSTGGDRDPSWNHIQTVERAKAYLAGTPKLGLRLGGLGKIALFAYSDAAYITAGNSKSRLGGCIFANTTSGAIRSWSKNDSISSHSSTEAEIRALDLVVLEVSHIMDLLTFVADEVVTPVKIFVDNLSAIDLCETLRQNHKVKHINVRINYIREMIEEGLIELHFCPSARNVADALTKPLACKEFKIHSEKLLHGHCGVEPGGWAMEEYLAEEVVAHVAVTTIWLDSL